ncbi:MAG: MerR family transcriptional regulator [Propionibacteriales bacterium]|nr:MerR family transcriptional regulator [Propionibacteriales bacterium]
MGNGYSIGEAAEAVGVDAHVLRHWEDVRVLNPARASSGHRRYSDNDLDEARLVRRAQRTGLTLPEIRILLTGTRSAREQVVVDRIDKLGSLIDRAHDTIDFLEHTRECRHRLVATCPQCHRYANG